MCTEFMIYKDSIIILIFVGTLKGAEVCCMIKDSMDPGDFREGALVEQKIIRDLVIRDTELYSMSFYECDFENCDFSKVSFMGCVFSDCRFLNCNLSLCRIPGCRLENTLFSGSKLVGIDWCVAAWRKPHPKKKYPFTIKFENCALNYSVFIEMNLYQAKFRGCTLQEAGFEHADLSFGDFTESDLSGAVFRDTNLTGADLSGARNYTINASCNILTKAKFSLPEALSLIYALDIEITE